MAFLCKIVMFMRRICTIVIIATLLTTGCTAHDCPQAVLEKFYDEYLALSCPPQGEYPNYEEVQQLLKQNLTTELYSALEASHDAESDHWIDYDMFIQGQDCWPGIRAERIERIDGSRWYVVEVVLPDMNNPDSIQMRNCVFFHLEKDDGDGQWLIGCIDDGYNRLGNAPREEEFALRNNLFYKEIFVIH